MVAVQVFQTVRDFQEERHCTAVVENMQTTITAQKNIYGDLMKSYEKAAYGNSSVDRIAEQQLIATESQLAAMQVIASQNGLLIELASVCK